MKALIILLAVLAIGCKKTYTCYQVDANGKHIYTFDGLTKEQKEHYESLYYEDITGQPISPIYECK